VSKKELPYILAYKPTPSVGGQFRSTISNIPANNVIIITFFDIIVLKLGINGL